MLRENGLQLLLPELCEPCRAERSKGKRKGLRERKKKKGKGEMSSTKVKEKTVKLKEEKIENVGKRDALLEKRRGGVRHTHTAIANNVIKVFGKSD